MLCSKAGLLKGCQHPTASEPVPEWHSQSGLHLEAERPLRSLQLEPRPRQQQAQPLIPNPELNPGVWQVEMWLEAGEGIGGLTPRVISFPFFDLV